MSTNMNMSNKGKIFLILFFVVVFTAFLFSAPAQAHVYDTETETYRAQVLDIISEEQREVEGTGVETKYQVIQAQILEGERTGDVIILEDDFLELEKGDKFFLNIFSPSEGEEMYSVEDLDRRGTILAFLLIFAVAVIVLGRMQGLRSILSLAGSIIIIIYVLLPQLLAGRSPLILSLMISIAILIFAIYTTHGINKKSNAALLGSIISILFTVVLAYIAVEEGGLSGFTDDVSTFLNFQTSGALNFRGLLLGAMIIGVLGILDDISITQASAVSEISSAAPHLSRREVYARALNIGREHVGALVNTLALAYAGAALPLMLLFVNSSASLDMIINREIFATEILRTIVGSVGIVLAVPLVTAISVLLLDKD